MGLVLGAAKAVVVGRDGDETASADELLHAKVTLRWTLVGTILSVVVVEHQSAGRSAGVHLITDGNCAGECGRFAEGVGRGILEVDDRHLRLGLIDRRGDARFLNHVLIGA